jgi:hypothetical protein
MDSILENGTTFIWKHARLLERAIFDFRFLNAPSQRILDILRTYQNEDGGFGHALEPDLRAPDSQPLFVEFALHTLYECQLRDPEIANRACDFLSRYTNLKLGTPTIFPSSQAYPRAPHWSNPANQQPSPDRMIGLVGLASWQGMDHPWLKEAVEVCLRLLEETVFEDAHTISTAFCLVESVSANRPTERLFTKLTDELFKANFFILEAPPKGYGLTPLEFAPSPDAYCRPIFNEDQINSHLDDLQTKQEEDGGWSIQWEAPGETATWEWRAQKTVKALSTLRAYGRI